MGGDFIWCLQLHRRSPWGRPVGTEGGEEGKRVRTLEVLAGQNLACGVGDEGGACRLSTSYHL